MKLFILAIALALLFWSVADAIPKTRPDEINWTQMLPEDANIILNGGDIIGQEYATQYDTIVYPNEDFTELHAVWGGNRTNIVEPTTISPDYNSLTIRAAINATPDNGTLLIAGGPYYCECDINCTAGPSTYIYFWTAFPLVKDIKIRGMGINATTLVMADNQYSSIRPALLFYDFHPYTWGPWGAGHKNVEISDMTLDGNIANQEPYYHDGGGLFLSGSPRCNLRMHDIECRYSPNHAIYLGYNGGGWENMGILENIYTHDNWGSSQLDNTEDTVVDHWVSERDGYGFWTASHYAVVFDGMMSNSGHLMVNDLHIRDGSLFIFGFQRLRDDVSMRISNLYIDSSNVHQSGVYVGDCNNVTISDGKIVAGTADYAISVTNSSNVYLDDLELRGMRALVTWAGTFSDIRADGCTLNTSENCFVIFSPSHAVFTSCDFYTSSASAYLVNVGSGATATIIGSRGSGPGRVYVGGTLSQAGNVGLGLEAYGATSVADGGTIAHGMKITPTYATATGSLAGTTVTVTAKDATHLTIDLAGVTTTQTVYWHAVY